MFNSRAFRAAALIVGALMSFSATAQSPSDAAAKPAKADPAAPLFAIYLVTGQPNAIEAMNVPLESLQLAPEPIVMERDLISFDRATMRFVFKPGVVGRFPQHPNVRGVPFVVVARGERIYAGAFWTMASSYLCEAPHLSFPYVTIENDGTTRPDTVVLENTTVDRPGVPDKPDPRLDPRILEALTRARVLAPRPGRFAGNDESTSPPLEALVPGAPLWPGFAIYLTAGGTTAHDFDKNKTPLGDIPLAAKPLFTEADIAGYDWALHIVHLKPGNMERLPPPRTVWGKPFVVVAGGERIYMGGIWTSLSSQSASFPVIDMSPFPVFPSSFEGGKGPVKPPDAFWIGPGYPGAMQGASDSRSDPRIRAALEKAGLLKAGGTSSAETPRSGALPGFAVYLASEVFTEWQGTSTQDLDKLHLEPDPLLTDRDLTGYDWTHQAMVLRPQAAAKVFGLFSGRLSERQRENYGAATLVVVAGGERIYAARQPVDNAFMLEGQIGFNSGFGVPASQTPTTPSDKPAPASSGWLQFVRIPGGSGADPRVDPRLRAALEKGGVDMTVTAGVIKP